MGYIYRIRNRITGKSYIGETIKEPTVRWKQHIACANAGKGCPALRDAFKKHGIESFEFKVIIICFDEDRFIYEREYIKRYNTQAPNGYNILPGGIGGPGFKGKVHTEDVRKVIGEKSKAMWKGFDETYINNLKEQISKTNKTLNLGERMKNSEKWKKYVSEMSEKRVGKRTHSDETKEKIRSSIKKYYSNNPQKKLGVNIVNIQKHRESMCKAVGRPIGQYDDNDVLIKQYKSISAAGRESGVKKPNILHVLRGDSKRAGGFVWKYLDNKT